MSIWISKAAGTGLHPCIHCDLLKGLWCFLLVWILIREWQSFFFLFLICWSFEAALIIFLTSCVIIHPSSMGTCFARKFALALKAWNRELLWPRWAEVDTFVFCANSWTCMRCLSYPGFVFRGCRRVKYFEAERTKYPSELTAQTWGQGLVKEGTGKYRVWQTGFPAGLALFILSHTQGWKNKGYHQTEKDKYRISVICGTKKW